MTLRTPRRRALAAVAVVVVVLGALLGGWRWATAPSFSDAGVRTVFVGDSITQAGSRSPTAMPSRRSWLRYVVTDDRTPWRFVANVAVSGQRLDEMAARFDRDVLARDPEAVVILGGTNDALQDVPVEESLGHLASMVTAAQDAGARVWVVSPPPLAPARGDVGPLRAAQEELVGTLGATWVDVVASVAAPDGSWAPGTSEDGVHPTVRGARAWAEAVLDEVTG